MVFFEAQIRKEPFSKSIKVEERYDSCRAREPQRCYAFLWKNVDSICHSNRVNGPFRRNPSLKFCWLLYTKKALHYVSVGFYCTIARCVMIYS